MRGRPPLPTAVKRLRGEKRKCRLNDREPTAPVGKSDCPEILQDDARREWVRLVPVLKKAGIFTAFDRSALIEHCRVWGSLMKYERLCDEVGPERAIEKGYHKAVLSLRAQHLKFCVEFGFTPSSRSRIKVPEAPPADGVEAKPDDFDAFEAEFQNEDRQPDA